MTEERITETRTPEGNTHTTTTVVTDQQKSGGGASMWIGLVVLLVVGVVAFLVFSRMSDSEVAKDNAVAEAASQVGDAAGQVGDAAEEAIDEVTE